MTEDLLIIQTLSVLLAVLLLILVLLIAGGFFYTEMVDEEAVEPEVPTTPAE